MPEGPMQKQDVPQMMPTGLSADYFNEFGWIVNQFRLNRADGLPPKANITTIKKYAERFPPTKYSNVITDENRELVEKLDKKVDELNTLIESPDDNTIEIRNLVVAMDKMVRGIF